MVAAGEGQGRSPEEVSFKLETRDLKHGAGLTWAWGQRSGCGKTLLDGEYRVHGMQGSASLLRLVKEGGWLRLDCRASSIPLGLET